MPNYVINKVRINANLDELIKIKKYVKKGKNKFDFNKIIPSPKELDGTAAPATIVKDQDIAKELAKFNKQKHPFGGRPISETENKELIKKCGTNNWYDWNIQNWGTKWNTDPNEIIEENFEYEFKTAWSTPEPVIQALSKKFPNALFEVQYADEDYGGGNVGTYEYQDGQIQNQTHEDADWGRELWGWEPEEPEEETNLDGLEEITTKTK